MKLKKVINIFAVLGICCALCALPGCEKEESSSSGSKVTSSTSSETGGTSSEDTSESSSEDTSETSEEAEASEAPTSEENSESNGDVEETTEKVKKQDAVNEWTDTDSLDVAIDTSGVYFTPPEAEYIPSEDASYELKGYRAADHIIEANYSDGKKDVCIRKSDKYSEEDLHGDYNKYSDSWDENFKGLIVHCKGANKKVNLATFSVDNYTFSVNINPGADGEGFSADDLKSVVMSTQ